MFQVWNLEGFKVALCYRQTVTTTETTAKGQLSSKVAEDAYQPHGMYLQLPGWTSTWTQQKVGYIRGGQQGAGYRPGPTQGQGPVEKG